MTFADVLKGLRAKAGLSQSKLAERSGVSVRTIQGWERGGRSPVSTDFFKLAAALGTDCRAFADCQNEDKPARRKRKGK